MTLLGSLVEASDRVSAASARLTKVRELAQFLRTLEPSELATGVLYLSGEVPQGRCGIGQTALRAADTVAAASTPYLSLAEVDQELGGTKPAEWDRDHAELLKMVDSFEAKAGHPHPIFGPLTAEEWNVWGFRHADHHLRQFGV